jgi:uncharacterized membrane protein YozB (DUF420 family)
MSGLFGTRAILQTDINLILQVSAIIIVLIGYLYKRRGRIRNHGALMGFATTLHTISFLAIMGPVFVSVFDFIATEFYTPLVISIVIHAIAGAIVLPLSIGLVVLWVRRISKLESCFKRKRVMVFTLGLWSASAFFGIIAYLLAYL